MSVKATLRPDPDPACPPRARTGAALVALVLVCAPVRALAQGTDWQVRTDGSDASCSGLLNAADPGTGALPRPCAFSTPQHAVDMASPGDTVLLHAGTYSSGGATTQGVTTIVGLDRRTEFDSEGNRLTVKAAGDGTVIFDGSSALHTGIVVWGTCFVTFEGIELRHFAGTIGPGFDWGASGVLVGSPGPDFPSRFLRFQSLVVTASTAHSAGQYAEMAIWCRDCTSNEITDSKIDSVEPVAIALGHDAFVPLIGDGAVSGCRLSHVAEGRQWMGVYAHRTNGWDFRGNYVTESASSTNPLTDGVRIEDSVGWTIAENVFYRLPQAGLHTTDLNADGDTIETHDILNNTADCGSLSSSKGLFTEGCTTCQVRNNIAVNCHAGVEASGDSSGSQLGPNGFFQDDLNYSNPGFGFTLVGFDVTADPRFQMQLPRPDPWYRLKVDSPDIDAGADAFCAVTPSDGHCDLGAYQAEPVANRPPHRPRIVLVDSITGVGARLNGSTYSDPENDAHAASQWQVDLAGGPFTSPVVDSGRDTNALLSFKFKGLASETDYVGRVRYQDAAGNWSDWSDTTDPDAAFHTLVATAIPPKVTAVVPAANAKGVAADATVSLTFNTPVAPASVTTTSVRLLLKGSAVAQAPGSPQVSLDGQTVTIQPAGLLVPEAKHTVSVTGGAAGVVSRDGAIPGKSFSSTFTVQSGVASSDPADGATGVPVSVAPSVTFLWTVNPATANTTTVTMKDVSSSRKVALASVTVSLDGLTVTATPASPLVSGHRYRLTIGSGAGGMHFADGRPLGKTVKIGFRAS